MKKNVVKKLKQINLRLNHFKNKFHIKSIHNTKIIFRWNNNLGACKDTTKM